MSFLMINSPIHKNPKEEYGEVLPPIGLWYICTNLQNNGIKVELLDSLASKKSLDEIISYINDGDFSYVGLNIFSTNHTLVQEIVCRVKRSVSFVIGWPFAKSNAQDIITWDTDNEIIIVIGEGDIIVNDIVQWHIKEKPIYEAWNSKNWTTRSTYYYLQMMYLWLCILWSSCFFK